MSSQLSPARRAEFKRTVKNTVQDLLVIGGGIVGAGVALDAATRGAKVALVETRDLASGTSSRSSKLVHGGVRYLEQLDFGLVREALVERGALLTTIAPHLVRPVRFVMPLTSGILQRGYFGAGLSLYDLFSRIGVGKPGVDHHRHLTSKQLQRAMPGLKKAKFRGALTYFDGRVDDARLVLEVARTAAANGAKILTRTEVKDFILERGRVVGAVVNDLVSGDSYEIRSKQVVVAAGVWTEKLVSKVAKPRFRVTASKGVHISVPRNRIDSKAGVISRTEKSVLFIIPWGEFWLIGTTDTPWSGSLDEPPATGADIDYLLATVNGILEKPLARKDITGVWSGLRPLVAGDAGDTTKLSREHLVSQVAPGLTAIVGGKLTTYRAMAEDVVSRLFPRKPSKTLSLPLVGAEGFTAIWERRGEIAAKLGLKPQECSRLLKRHGSGVLDILELCEMNPKLARRIGNSSYLWAEVPLSVTHEGALSLEDVVVRRLRLHLEDRAAIKPVLKEVAAMIAPLLGWKRGETAKQISMVLRSLAAEDKAVTVSDDETADSLRNKK